MRSSRKFLYGDSPQPAPAARSQGAAAAEMAGPLSPLVRHVAVRAARRHAQRAVAHASAGDHRAACASWASAAMEYDSCGMARESAECLKLAEAQHALHSRENKPWA